jgi:DNA-binding protein H-NS
VRRSARLRLLAYSVGALRHIYFHGFQCHAMASLKISNLIISTVPGDGMAIDLKRLNQIQLNDLIQRAEMRKQEIKREAAGKVRARLSALAKSEGFTIEELFGNRARKGKGTRRPAKIKYRNPADHAQTWSGRGKQPRWFNAALTAGKKEKDLLI